jgi:hypothetical protein
VWAEGQMHGFNIAEAAERSDTVTTVTMGNGYDPVALETSSLGATRSARIARSVGSSQ